MEQLPDIYKETLIFNNAVNEFLKLLLLTYHEVPFCALSALPVHSLLALHNLQALFISVALCIIAMVWNSVSSSHKPHSTHETYS